MRSGGFAVAAFVAVLCLAAPDPGEAHTRSASYSSWWLTPDGARVRLRTTLLDLSRLGLAPGGLADDAGAMRYLVPRLELVSGGEACRLAEPPQPLAAAAGWARYEWRVSCGASGVRSIASAAFLDVAPSHLHFARVEDPAGAIRERVLTEAAPRWELGGEAAGEPSGDASGTALSGYVALGVLHIVSGWDHLAFVLALLLLAGGVGEVARLVTGFTLAHSLTLALAVVGVLRPEPAAVEALIGFSIALAATENSWLLAGRPSSVPVVVTTGVVGLALAAWLGFGVLSAATLLGLAVFTSCHFGLLMRVRRPTRLRVAVAFAFGLVHGFGFAGVLAELSLPTSRLVPALFGFNLGVELGQLGAVAAVWPVLRLLERAATAHRAIAEIASAALCGLGLFWLVTRIYG